VSDTCTLLTRSLSFKRLLVSFFIVLTTTFVAREGINLVRCGPERKPNPAKLDVDGTIKLQAGNAKHLRITPTLNEGCVNDYY
jgi:hypothetical protein